MTTDTTDALGEGTVLPEDNTMPEDEMMNTGAETYDTGADGQDPGAETVDDEGNPFALEGEDSDGSDGGDNEPFSLDLPEEAVTPENAEMYERLAKEAGLSGGKAGRYISAVIRSEIEKNAQTLNAQEAELRKEWGAEFTGRVKEVRSFIKQLAGRSGVPEKVMNIFASPAGYKLMYALKQGMGESKFVQGRPHTKESDIADADRMIKDPRHPLYKAFYDAEDARHEEAHRIYNRAHGWE